jgi:hypothetical protein
MSVGCIDRRVTEEYFAAAREEHQTGLRVRLQRGYTACPDNFPGEISIKLLRSWLLFEHEAKRRSPCHIGPRRSALSPRFFSQPGNLVSIKKDGWYLHLNIVSAASLSPSVTPSNTFHSFAQVNSYRNARIYPPH